MNNKDQEKEEEQVQEEELRLQAEEGKRIGLGIFEMNIFPKLFTSKLRK